MENEYLQIIVSKILFVGALVLGVIIGLFHILDKLGKLPCNEEDVIIDKRQNVKVGNTWVTIQSNDNDPIWTDYEIELRNEIDKAYREYLNKAKTLNCIDNEIMNSPFYNDSKIVEHYFNHCEFDVNKNRWIPIKNNEVVHSVTFENGKTKYIKLQR